MDGDIRKRVCPRCDCEDVYHNAGGNWWGCTSCEYKWEYQPGCLTPVEIESQCSDALAKEGVQ